MYSISEVSFFLEAHTPNTPPCFYRFHLHFLFFHTFLMKRNMETQEVWTIYNLLSKNKKGNFLTQHAIVIMRREVIEKKQ